MPNVLHGFIIILARRIMRPVAFRYRDYYERAKFRLTWSLNVMLFVTLLLITVIYVFIEPKFVYHYASGTLMSLLGILYMYFTKKYKLASMVLTILAFILVTTSIFFVKGALHIIEPFWLLNIVLYSYFTLGERWGRMFIAGMAVVVACYFFFGLRDNLELLPELSDVRVLAMGAEFMICSSFIAYIVYQFTKTNGFAEREYREANVALRTEKQRVETKNAEKTALIQEIHHRVKNNLQVITSLLRLQSVQLKSEEAKEGFQDAINRVMTMALIHQKMYESENLADIDLKDYFQALLNEIVATNTTQENFMICTDIGTNNVGSRSIVPLALILNELVTNSIKHGFTETERGTIDLSITDIDADHIRMVYSDNGKWKETKDSASLGLQLIEVFTEQLEGSYEFEASDTGTHYTFELKRLEDK